MSKKDDDFMTFEEITQEELEKHNDDSGNPWIMIEGRIVDVTEFRDEHPGGEVILDDSAGTDATQEFQKVDHSNEAKAKMRSLTIGRLKGYGVPKDSPKEVKEHVEESENISNIVNDEDENVEQESSWGSWLTSQVSKAYNTTNQIGENLVAFVRDEFEGDEEGEKAEGKDLIDSGLETIQSLSSVTTKAVEDMVKSGKDLINQKELENVKSIAAKTLHDFTERTKVTGSWLLNSAKLLFDDEDDTISIDYYFRVVEVVNALEVFNRMNGGNNLDALEQLGEECENQIGKLTLDKKTKKLFAALTEILDSKTFVDQNELTDDLKSLAQSSNGKELQNLSQRASDAARNLLLIQSKYAEIEGNDPKKFVELSGKLMNHMQKIANECFAEMTLKAIFHLFSFCDTLTNIQQEIMIPYEFQTEKQKKKATLIEAAQQIRSYGLLFTFEMNSNARLFSKTIQTLNSFCNSFVKESAADLKDEIQEVDNLTINAATDCILQNDKILQIFLESFQYVQPCLEYTYAVFDAKKFIETQVDDDSKVEN